MIRTALAAARADLRQAAVRRHVLLGILLTAALLLVAYAIFLALIDLAEPETLVIPFAGPVRGLGTLLSAASIAFALALSVMLMAPVAAGFAPLMLPDLARAAGSAPPRPGASLGTSLIAAANGFGLLTMAMMAAFATLPVIALGALALHWLLGGFLLGRLYLFEALGLRLGRTEARALAARHRGTVLRAGLILALALSVPLLSLAVPGIAALAFARLAEALERA